MYRIYFTFLLGSILLVAGCGRSKSDPNLNEKKADLTQDSGDVKFTIKTKRGDEIHITRNKKGVSPPEKFPKDVPLYPDAVITMKSIGIEGITLELETNDSLQQVEEYYKSKLTELGWTHENLNSTSNIATVVFKKEERVLIIFIESHEKTKITLVTSEE